MGSTWERRALRGLMGCIGVSWMLAVGCTGGPEAEQPSASTDESVDEPADTPRGKAGRRGKGGGNARGGKMPGVEPNPGGGGGNSPSVLRVACNNGSALERTQDGTLHAVWIDRNKLVYARYLADGSEDKDELADDARAHAILDTDGEGGVAVVWTAKAGGVYAVTSSDGGESFSAPVQLTDAMVDAPTLRVWKSGGVLKKETVAIASWHEGVKNESTHVYTSTLREGSWSKKDRIDKSTREAAFPSAAGVGDLTYVAWRDNSAGAKEWELTLSMQDGLDGSWSSPVKIRDGHDPSLCVTANGWIHLGYQHEVKSFYIRSTDKGASWSAPIELGPGLYSKAACGDDGHVAVAFEWMDPSHAGGGGNKGPRPDIKTVGLAKSTDFGNHFDVSKPVDKMGLLFATAAISPDGKLDLMYVDSAVPAVKIKPIAWE